MASNGGTFVDFALVRAKKDVGNDRRRGTNNTLEVGY
jgi:hypothetical protein